MSSIQAVLFNINNWSTATARKWLKEHNIKPIKRVHKQGMHYRYRIKKPDPNKNYAIKKLGNGIEIVIIY
jgi:hypothetical protein